MYNDWFNKTFPPEIQEKHKSEAQEKNRNVAVIV